MARFGAVVDRWLGQSFLAAAEKGAWLAVEAEVSPVRSYRQFPFGWKAEQAATHSGGPGEDHQCYLVRLSELALNTPTYPFHPLYP